MFFFNSNNSEGRLNKGFSLIELLVAFTVFAIASLMITASFLSVVDTERRVEQNQQIFDEFRLMTESLEREISFGNSFRQPTSCGNSCIEFVVRTRDDIPQHMVAYRLNGNKIEKAVQQFGGECFALSTVSAANFTLPDKCFAPISSDSVNITSLIFSVDNYTGPSVRPLITYSVQGEAKIGATDLTTLEYSTTVTPRDGQNPSSALNTDGLAPVIFIEEYSDGVWTPVTSPIIAGAATLRLRGHVYDAQSPIVAMHWENDNLYFPGLQSAPIPLPNVFGEWTSGPINITPGIDNHIVVFAEDAQGNVISESVVARTGAGSEVPPIPETLGVSQVCFGDYSAIKFSFPSNEPWRTWSAEVCSRNPSTDPVCDNTSLWNLFGSPIQPIVKRELVLDVWDEDCNFGSSPYCLGREYCARRYNYDPDSGLRSLFYVESCEIFDSITNDNCSGGVDAISNLQGSLNKSEAIVSTRVGPIVDSSFKIYLSAHNYNPPDANFFVNSAPAGWSVTVNPNPLPSGQFAAPDGAQVIVTIPAGELQGQYELSITAVASESADKTDSLDFILKYTLHPGDSGTG